ncbi:MAG: hypothetical protein HFG55_05330 [Lachnospiraceae bacterium]|nr:hypothetical protein [Lachnospiraceae bacterium]
MKKNHKKALSVFLACCMLSSVPAMIPVLAAEPADSALTVSFAYCAINSVPDKTGPDGYPLRYLDNDLFYIEYPGSWSFGTSKICPIVFFNNSEMPKTTHEFETFQDSALIGSEDEIDLYIQGGGLNQYLQQVLNISDLAGYQFDVQTKESTILVYSLKKEDETVASIIVWTSFGQVSIQDERPEVSVNPLRDYGNIMVMPVADSEDFSSHEAIQAYVNSGKLNERLKIEPSVLSWTTKPFQTEYHSYLLCEGSCEFLNASVYIPVTPAGTKNWMVSFDAFKESEIASNAYRIQEDIIKTFKVLK